MICRDVRPLVPRRIAPVPELVLEDELEEKRMRTQRRLCVPTEILGPP